VRLQDPHLVVLARVHELGNTSPQDDPKLTSRPAAVTDLLEARLLKREGRNYAITNKGLKAINGTS